MLIAACIALTLLCLDAAKAPESPRPRSSRLGDYYDPTLRYHGDLVRHAGLKYTIIYRERDSETPRIATESRTFTTGEAVKIQVESNVDGYLYIIQRGTSGRQELIFPKRNINNGDNFVRAWEKLTVPRKGWFEIVDRPGVDVVTLVLSRVRLWKPQEDREKPEQYVASRMKSLSATRDLVFVPEEAPSEDIPGATRRSTVVVNKNPDSNDIVRAVIRITHRSRASKVR